MGVEFCYFTHLTSPHKIGEVDDKATTYPEEHVRCHNWQFFPQKRQKKDDIRKKIYDSRLYDTLFFRYKRVVKPWKDHIRKKTLFFSTWTPLHSYFVHSFCAPPPLPPSITTWQTLSTNSLFLLVVICSSLSLSFCHCSFSLSLSNSKLPAEGWKHVQPFNPCPPIPFFRFPPVFH